MKPKHPTAVVTEVDVVIPAGKAAKKSRMAKLMRKLAEAGPKHGQESC